MHTAELVGYMHRVCRRGGALPYAQYNHSHQGYSTT
jgi:hypothetical protein